MSRPAAELNQESLWQRIWGAPDYLLVEAGASGELLVARTRLLLICLLFLVPVTDAIWGQPSRLESMIGIGAATTAIILSIIVYVLASNLLYTRFLSFLSSVLDVTLVSAALAAFLFFNAPHTSVNSKVIFLVYFIAIGATTLRYDARICLLAGALALLEYAAIVLYAALHWNLNDPSFAPFTYGVVQWGDQISRLILLLVASLLSTTVVLRVQQLRRLSTVDRLTGLFNRGYFDERFATELGGAKRYGRTLALAMIDVDNFKPFNDTYGHTAGDTALKTTASVIRSLFRSSDVVARYGGEEFVIIMLETDRKTALEKMQAVRQEIEATEIALPKTATPAKLTISAGIACYPEDGEKESDLLYVADSRLFAAKKEGRNRVVG